MNRSIAASLALFLGFAPSVLAASRRDQAHCWIDSLAFDRSASEVMVYGSGRKPIWTEGKGVGHCLYLDLMGSGDSTAFLKPDRTRRLHPHDSPIKAILCAPNRRGIVRLAIEAAAPFHLHAHLRFVRGGWILNLPLLVKEGKVADRQLAVMKRRLKRKTSPLKHPPKRLRLARLPAPPKLPTHKPVAVRNTRLPVVSWLPPSTPATASSPSILSDMPLGKTPITQIVPYKGDRPHIRIGEGSDGRIHVFLQALPSEATPSGVALVKRQNGVITVSFVTVASPSMK